LSLTRRGGKRGSEPGFRDWPQCQPPRRIFDTTSINKGWDKRYLIALSVLAASCAHAAAPLSDVAWLQGCWAVEGAEQGTGEQWSSPVGGAMVGAGRRVRNGKMVEVEFMKLREVDGKLAYVVVIPGQKEVVFMLQPGGGDELVFESAKHDFPQRIVYRRMEAPRLHARIEGS
jgi:hypothetical protein